MLPAFSTPAFRKLVRASAWYDVIVTAPFATPPTFAWLAQNISAVNVALGGAALPPFAVFHTFIACLLGSIVMVWSVLRIRDPQVRFGRYDAAGRMLFSTWMVWALFHTGAPVLWLFVVPEFLWGVAQLWPVREHKNNLSSSR